MSYSIPILMSEVESPLPLESFQKTQDSPFKGSHVGTATYFGASGRFLLGMLLENMELSRSDVISILTTTNDIYVSSCVSLTSFNHASISRDIVERTKVVIVIHEHGYSYPGVSDLRLKCDEKGILLIEDCAHVLGIEYPEGRSVGSYGHYALYSLPKIFPMKQGGMLRTSHKFHGAGDKELEKDFDQYLPYWKSMNSAREDRLELVRKAGHKIILPSNIYAPWFARISTGESAVRDQRIEYGATLRTDIQLIPTNPLVPETIFSDILCSKGA